VGAGRRASKTVQDQHERPSEELLHEEGQEELLSSLEAEARAAHEEELRLQPLLHDARAEASRLERVAMLAIGEAEEVKAIIALKKERSKKGGTHPPLRLRRCQSWCWCMIRGFVLCHVWCWLARAVAGCAAGVMARASAFSTWKKRIATQFPILRSLSTGTNGDKEEAGVKRWTAKPLQLKYICSSMVTSSLSLSLSLSLSFSLSLFLSIFLSFSLSLCLSLFLSLPLSLISVVSGVARRVRVGRLQRCAPCPGAQGPRT
jgi:hypothetical protein